MIPRGVSFCGLFAVLLGGRLFLTNSGSKFSLIIFGAEKTIREIAMMKKLVKRTPMSM